MACGKPIILSNTNGNRDIVAETDAGIVTHTELPREFATAIIKLLEDKNLSQRLGENGRKATVEKYSWSKIAERVAELFDGAMKR